MISFIIEQGAKVTHLIPLRNVCWMEPQVMQIVPSAEYMGTAPPEKKGGKSKVVQPHFLPSANSPQVDTMALCALYSYELTCKMDSV